jgi:hypothetical protein
LLRVALDTRVLITDEIIPLTILDDIATLLLPNPRSCERVLRYGDTPVLTNQADSSLTASGFDLLHAICKLPKRAETIRMSALQPILDNSMLEIGAQQCCSPTAYRLTNSQ